MLKGSKAAGGMLLGAQQKLHDGLDAGFGSPSKLRISQESAFTKRRRGLQTVAFMVALCYALVAFLRLPEFTFASNTYALCSKPGSGARIYTVDTSNNEVECLWIENDLVTKTGSRDVVLASLRGRFFSKLPVKYIPENAIVIPGITDSHCHSIGYGTQQLMDLESARNVSEAVSVVRNFILSHPSYLHNKTKIIDGWGWDHTIWDEGGSTSIFPNASAFLSDPVTADRFIRLRSKDGHAIWVSPRTLEANEPIPLEVPGGIVVVGEDGKPSGVFVDDAQDLIAAPVLTDEDMQMRWNLTVKDALENGLTSLHDALLDPDLLDFFLRESKRVKLPLRLYAMGFFDERTSVYWGNTTRPLVNGGKGGRFTWRAVKMLADGAMRTGGAALYEPYSDNPSEKGFIRLSNHTLERIVPQFLRDGWQVNIHAIGDRANGAILDAFQRALNTSDRFHTVDMRPRLEHAQIMIPEDVERLGKMGVIASIQPTHVVDDMWYAEDRLGPDRIRNLYAFRSIVDAGARITLGSDFPVENPNPLKGFYAAITRSDYDGKSPHGPDGYFPEQRLTRIEALRAPSSCDLRKLTMARLGMTVDPAYASYTEDTLGSLEPQKKADFVVLSQDIMSLSARDVLETKVLATVIDGEVMFGAI